MSQAEPEDILQQIDVRVAALAAAEKQLKRPSTISFAERRDLAAKASRAAGGLRARRAELEGPQEATQSAEAPDAEAPDAEAPAAAASSAPDPVQAALDEADRVLGLIGAAQPAGMNRRGMSHGKLPGQQRRGPVGSPQQRPPDRVGE
jgi:hypothetical protein